MKFTAFAFRSLLWLCAPLFFASSLAAGGDRPLKPAPFISREVTALMRLLEEVHYNRDAVKPADYGQVIPDYMAELDGPRLFFLASDKQKFTDAYKPRWLFDNISGLGKIDPAYEIFATYDERVRARITWILEELKKEIDLGTQDTYLVDRSKADWPADAAAADDIWRKRLKFEMIQEVLNKKSVDEAKQNIRKRYERLRLNIDEFESSDIAEMFLSTVTRLYDPHSTYFSADTFEDFGIQMRLQLIGIGAILGMEEDRCVIKELVPGGPADLSKQLRPKDVIVAVAQTNAEPVEIPGMKLRKIVDMIRGPRGTQVKLIVQPADATETDAHKEVVITRNIVNLDSARARGAIFDVPDTSGKITPIGVITLPAFYGPDGTGDGESKNSATKDVAELIKRLQSAGIEGLVLDLRHNGGGLLSEAIDLAGLFIKQGPVVQVRTYYGDVKVDSDEDPSIAYSGPLAVLTSKFSASASEIVAGALQNYGRAIVIGDSSTHGKGSVQTVIEMKTVLNSLSRAIGKTGAAKLTVQKFYLPDGHSTQLKGVVPDIVLPSIDDYLPIGEKDLPHALVWDEIPSATFDGKPLDEKVVSHLRELSTIRQSKLEEFTFLKKNIDWFKTKQDQKVVTLNLEERRKQKESDTAFKKSMDAEKAALGSAEYAYREFNLGAPKPPKAKVEKKPGKDGDAPDDDSDLSTDDSDNYRKADIHLREALRVLDDALEMGRKPELWASDHAPLTVRVTKKS